MGRRTILLIAAVVIAAIGATMIFLYVQGIQSRAEADQKPVEVLKATDVIAAGETIEAAQDAGKLALKSVPREDVVPGALTSTQTLSGEVALAPIYPEEQIIADKFGQIGIQQQITIPDGSMAVSVQLTDPGRVAGFVTPGSKVAVFLSGTPEAVDAGGQTKTLPTFTRLLLPSVDVIGVGDTTVLNTTKTDPTGATTTEQIPKTILTLALTQEQAEKIIYAAKNGELAMGLLNDKSKVRDSAGVDASNLFN